jgi:hypothetical protein
LEAIRCSRGKVKEARRRILYGSLRQDTGPVYAKVARGKASSLKISFDKLFENSDNMSETRKIIIRGITRDPPRGAAVPAENAFKNPL